MTTLLTAVNAVLNKVHITSGSGALSSLTDSGRQIYIDEAVRLWNEAIDTLYDMTGSSRVQEAGETTVTLVTDTREYSLPSGLVQVRWPLVEAANGYVIYAYPGGYEQMRIDQRQPDDWAGLPLYACINPVTNKLRVDRAPTLDENGLEFTLLYDKDNSMTAASDTLPVPDAVYRALIPVVATRWEGAKRNNYDEGEWRRQLSRAASFMARDVRRTHW